MNGSFCNLCALDLWLNSCPLLRSCFIGSYGPLQFVAHQLAAAFADDIIFLNHHFAIKPVTPKTVAKNCLVPGNEEKETLRRSPFDIPARSVENTHDNYDNLLSI